jgi:hypothetical protein
VEKGLDPCWSTEHDCRPFEELPRSNLLWNDTLSSPLGLISIEYERPRLLQRLDRLLGRTNGVRADTR